MDNEPENPPHAAGNSSQIIRAAKIAGIVVVCLWAINLAVGVLGLCSNGKGAELGDSFGIVNALFSGLAFAGVIVALWMQREELSLQRKELADTRAEITKQTAIQGQHVQLLSDEREDRENLRRDAAMPRLMLREVEKLSRIVKVRLINAGAPIFDLHASEPNSTQGTADLVSLEDDQILDRNDSTEVTFELSDHSYHLPGTYSFKHCRPTDWARHVLSLEFARP